jgi:hypothetical protein
VQYANTLLKDRILFGSDFPLITPDRWLKDFEEAGFKEDVKPLILKQNAMRLLGLGGEVTKAPAPPEAVPAPGAAAPTTAGRRP